MTQTAPQLNISITPLKNALLVSEKQDLQVLVRLQAEQTNTTKHMPLSVALVIDRSGSMRGDRILAAKNACQEFVSRLSDEDELGLVVDDSHVALQQSMITLRKLELDCQMVRSAASALQVLLAEHEAGRPIEVLVSDIEMPEMAGYDLVRAIRKQADIGQTYVLLHTSLDSTMNTEKARAVGANDVLTKFSTVDLSKALVRAFSSLS